MALLERCHRVKDLLPAGWVGAYDRCSRQASGRAVVAVAAAEFWPGRAPIRRYLN
jgi:hypothetical protein